MPDPRSVADLRRDYSAAGLDEADLAGTWLAQFERWFAEATSLVEPNAVVLATAATDGRPSARTVLLKGVSARGFDVFTNPTSRKASEATTNPQASLCFSWVPLERQVVVVGAVEVVDRDEVEAYFRTRPRASQVGAWVSRQSTVVASRAELEAGRSALEARFDGAEVPVPDFWGGLRVVPSTVEFWQGRTGRLHDRLRFRADGDGWVVERLAP